MEWLFKMILAIGRSSFGPNLNTKTLTLHTIKPITITCHIIFSSYPSNTHNSHATNKMREKKSQIIKTVKIKENEENQNFPNDRHFQIDRFHTTWTALQSAQVVQSSLPCK